MLLADGDTVLGQLGDAERVLVGFRRETDEEVELDPLPALGEGGVDRLVEILLTDQLVDDLPHPPRARFRGEGETTPLGPLQLGGDANAEGVDPK